MLGVLGLHTSKSWDFKVQSPGTLTSCPPGPIGAQQSQRDIWYNILMTSFSNIQTECHNREDWEYIAEWASETAKSEAADEFRNSPEARRLANSDAIFNYIAESIKSIRDDKPPAPMPSFIASELTALLSTKMWTECEQYMIKNGLPDDAFDTSDGSKILDTYYGDVWTDEYALWRQIVVALAAFLREAAAFAKKSGSMDAARKLILTWRYVNRLDDSIYVYMSKQESNAVMITIREAIDILWADAELAKLP